MEIETLTTELEDIDLQGVDDYLDSEVKDQIKEEEASQMMYEEDRLWNMVQSHNGMMNISSLWMTILRSTE